MVVYEVQKLKYLVEFYQVYTLLFSSGQVPYGGGQATSDRRVRSYRPNSYICIVLYRYSVTLTLAQPCFHQARDSAISCFGKPGRLGSEAPNLHRDWRRVWPCWLAWNLLTHLLCLLEVARRAETCLSTKYLSTIRIC